MQDMHGGHQHRACLEFPEGSAPKQVIVATYNDHILASLNIFNTENKRQHVSKAYQSKLLSKILHH